MPRLVHPGAWWLWALGCAVAASRTTNPLLLILLIIAIAVVVQARRPHAPWSRAFGLFLRLGLVIVLVRVGVQVLLGANSGGEVLVPLPGLTLPDWLSNLRLGGDVTVQGLLTALADGLRLATIVICLGAANSLAAPARLLKSIPAALYQLGVSVVVAMTFVPQLVADLERIRASRRLRGRRDTGVRALGSTAIPVLEGALERSVTLAAAMDSRGYGRTRHIPVRERRATAAALLAGLVATALGMVGLLSEGTPATGDLALVAAGVAVAAGAALLAGRRSVRSTYRPDPWRAAEWSTALAGVGVASVFLLASARGWGVLTPTDPPTWPVLPLLPLAAIALAASPAWTTPPPPMARRSSPLRQMHLPLPSHARPSAESREPSADLEVLA